MLAAFLRKQNTIYMPEKKKFTWVLSKTKQNYKHFFFRGNMEFMFHKKEKRNWRFNNSKSGVKLMRIRIFRAINAKY